MPLFLFIFVLLPLIELAGLLAVGTYIGVAPTIAAVILSGLVGIYLAKSQGLRVLREVNHALNRGEPPGRQMLAGLMVFLGGVLLIAPGFISDFLGIMFLLPWTRNALVGGVVSLMRRAMLRTPAGVILRYRTASVRPITRSSPQYLSSTTTREDSRP